MNNVNPFIIQNHALWYSPLGTKRTPAQKIVVDGKYLTYYSLHSESRYIRTTVTNLIRWVSYGHRVAITFKHIEVEVDCPPFEAVYLAWLNQAKYLAVAGYPSHKINPILKTVACRFFKVPTWDKASDLLLKEKLPESSYWLIARNLVKEALIELTYKKDTLQEERITQDLLTPVLAGINIPKEYWDILPNQDITYPERPFPYYRERWANGKHYLEKDHPWKTYVSTYDQEMTKAINAWFYSHAEFRVPTREELEQELDVLQIEYVGFKEQVRKAPETQRAELISNWVDKYARLIQLQTELNLELYGDIHAVDKE